MADTLVVDLGAGFVKIGSADEAAPHCVINSVTKAKHVKTRVFVGNEINDCKDLSGLYYQLPFQKGCLLNWELEKQILDHCFKPYAESLPLSERTLVVTEPVINFAPVAEAMDEVFFEEYGFKEIVRVPAPFLVQLRDSIARGIAAEQQRCLLLDCGYSFSHAMAFSAGRLLPDSVRRVNVGGKVLTNYLKEVVSYRQLMVMDETHVMNQCKEDACFVSLNFNKDLRDARSSGSKKLHVDYVLPDYSHARRGYLQDKSLKQRDSEEQALRLSIERFATPELLFHPSDVGIEEMGIVEALASLLPLLPQHEVPLFSDNILLAGGSCSFPNFAQRVRQEMRSVLPDDFPLTVRNEGNPAHQAWLGGAALANSHLLQQFVITKQQYKEMGSELCSQTFNQLTKHCDDSLC